MPPDIKAKWGNSVGKIIQAVREEVCRVRICQKVFPTKLLPDPQQAPDDSLALPDISSIPERGDKPCVEISTQYTLTSTQVDNEPTEMICQTLAQMGARAIALVEDMIIFQGSTAPVPKNVEVGNLDKNDKGLLGAADPDKTSDTDPNLVSIPITVPLSQPKRPGILWGENTFTAVTAGIAKLSSKGQSIEYALFLPTVAFADTLAPPGNESLVNTYERLQPWLKGGIYGTATLPPDKGLLVAVSNAICLYVGVDSQPEYDTKDGVNHRFLVRERIQSIARDPRALVLLNFEQPNV
jgi:uncharacterized linocin/CFP29 family protein